MKHLSLLLVVALTPIPAIAGGKACTLPIPDGSDIKPTSPSLAGVVRKAHGNLVVIKQSGQKTYALRLTQKSEIFTVYGGGLGQNDIKPGQHTLVWLEKCSKPGTTSRVAVLQVCSTTTEPCPK